jgi:hypothetical protein
MVASRESAAARGSLRTRIGEHARLPLHRSAQCAAKRLWQIDGHEKLRGIELVLARLIDDPQQAMLLRAAIGGRPVDLPHLERCRIVRVAHANHEANPLAGLGCHGGSPYQALDLHLVFANAGGLVPVQLGFAHESVRQPD